MTVISIYLPFLMWDEGDIRCGLPHGAVSSEALSNGAFDAFFADIVPIDRLGDWAFDVTGRLTDGTEVRVGGGIVQSKEEAMTAAASAARAAGFTRHR